MALIIIKYLAIHMTFVDFCTVLTVSIDWCWCGYCWQCLALWRRWSKSSELYMRTLITTV